MHAVPGGGSAGLEAGGKAIGDAVAFGEVTPFVEVPDGSVELALAPDGGGKPLAEATENLSGGRYTVVATKPNGGISLRVYRDSRAEPGQARLRAIHAAPELGAVEVALDGRDLGAPLRPGRASPYETVEPGTYELRALRPRGGGPPLAASPGTDLTAGTAATAFVIGSGGERTRIVVATDATAAPKKGPATGLGGLSGDTPWRFVLAAALAAGMLGGSAYGLAFRRDGD